MTRVHASWPRWSFIPVSVALLLLAGCASDARPAAHAESAAPRHVAEQPIAPGATAAPEQPAERPATLIAHAAQGTAASPLPAEPAPEPPAEEPPAEEAVPAPEPAHEQGGGSSDAGQAPAAPDAPAEGGTQTEPQVSFRSCAEAEAAGAAPLSQGDPGYGTHLDRDGDGVACEQK